LPERLLVNLRTIPHGAGAKRTVFLGVKGPFRDQTTLKIESLDPQQDFLATLGDAIRDNPKTVRYPLTIEIPASAPPVARNGDPNYAKIKLSTTHPQVKEVVVNVRYIVKE
jgi:hypothetical protein